MLTERLQRWLDAARATSAQRWALGAVAVSAVVVALAATVLGSGERFGWFPWFVVITAAVAAVQAGSHTATLTIALVAMHWLAIVDEVTTPRTLVVAVCLLTFHSTLALMAVSPHSSNVHTAVVRTWAQRAALVGAATAAVWVLVVVFDRRDADADPWLTVAALAALAAGALALRRRSVDEPSL